MSQWFESYGWAEVHDNLIVGAYPLDARDVETLRGLGVRRVLNLVQDDEYEDGERAAVVAALREAGIAEQRIDLVDYATLPAEALERAVATVVDWVADGECTYLHCRAGWQRSSTVAAGAVAILDGTGIEAALSAIRARKPSANPLPHQRVGLARWWAGRGGAPG